MLGGIADDGWKGACGFALAGGCHSGVTHLTLPLTVKSQRRDDDDGVLVVKEAEAEKRAIEGAVAAFQVRESGTSKHSMCGLLLACHGVAMSDECVDRSSLCAL